MTRLRLTLCSVWVSFFLVSALGAQPTMLRDHVPDLGKTDGPIVGKLLQTPDKQEVTIQYDDGELDNGYGAGPPATSFEVGMLFELPSVPATVQQLSVCFDRVGTQDEIDFSFNFYDNDGANGAPGLLLSSFTATIENLQPGIFFDFDFSRTGLSFTDRDFYVVVEWDPTAFEDFFLCSDSDGASVQPGYSRLDGGTWEDLTEFDNEYTALLLRGVFDVQEPTSTCVEDATTLCLLNDRFEVRTAWRRNNGQTGVGQAVELTSDTGYFWFFDDSNVEMVVKTLDACDGFNHFWFFAGGLTNVEVDITVTDTETGEVNTYTNPLNTPFQPIQDTTAFATCP